MKGYTEKIIINVGINAWSEKEARKEAKDMAKTIEIKLEEYLKQFPYWIEVKGDKWSIF